MPALSSPPASGSIRVTSRPLVPARAPGLYFAGVPTVSLSLTNLHSPAVVTASSLIAGADHDFLQQIFDRAGLRLSYYRGLALLRRIPACRRLLGVSTTAAAALRLKETPGLAFPLLDTVLLGVTEFRRDTAVFQTLAQEILPEMLAQRAEPRVWSAGCSEGQELYSIAACLAESGALERCELVGTDCRPKAIVAARSGEYSPEQAAALDVKWHKRVHFALADRVRLHPRLRDAITWRVRNVLSDPEPGNWDMILCRNLAIYLEATTAARLWRRLVDRLLPGGWLVVGKAETPTHPLLQRVHPCVYRRRPA